MECKHISNINVQKHEKTKELYNDCGYCFVSCEQGINVCLICFETYCSTHSFFHKERRSHYIYQTIKRTRHDDNQENTGYSIESFITCLECDVHIGNDVLKDIEDQIKRHYTLPQQYFCPTVMKIECEHLIDIQPQSVNAVSSLDIKCNDCEMTDNLWMCLICGNIGCGRKQLDDSGGNNHAIEHFKNTSHAVSSKFKTASIENQPDSYCYKCDNVIQDVQYLEHFKSLGYDVTKLKKTEPTLGELEYSKSSNEKDNGSQNITLLVPENRFVGIKNTSNNCYISVILQSLFHIEVVNQRLENSNHFEICSMSPFDCLKCNLIKIKEGLNNTIHSGLDISSFRKWVMKNNSEFSNYKQQDVYDFWSSLLRGISSIEYSESCNTKITPLFEFQIVQKLACNQCEFTTYSKTTYTYISLFVSDKTTTLDEAFRKYMEPEIVCFICQSCKHKEGTKSLFLDTTPHILLIQLHRFTWDNTYYKPVKIVDNIQVPIDNLDLSAYVTPNDIKIQEPSDVNSSKLNELIEMGFLESDIRRALVALGNDTDLYKAMTWIIDNPAVQDVLDDDLIAQVSDLGFPIELAKEALLKTNLDPGRAVDFILSNSKIEEIDAQSLPCSTYQYRLISAIHHTGDSVDSGHYISYIQTSKGWTVYNDEKVGTTDSPPLDKGYLFFYIPREV